MAANLNIFIRPVEMYLMMASVCPSVSSSSMNVKRKPMWGRVSGVGWRKLSRLRGLSPGLEDGEWSFLMCGLVQAPLSSLPSTMTVNRLMEKNSLFLSVMGLCHLAHCDFLIQRFFSSCAQNWTFLLYFIFIAASSQHRLLLLAHFMEDWSLKSCCWNILTAVIRNIFRQ